MNKSRVKDSDKALQSKHTNDLQQGTMNLEFSNSKFGIKAIISPPN